MQNPFVRLRKYRCDRIDPFEDENRATETLAACLVFSQQFRSEFLRFLFQGKPRCESMIVGDCEIFTQLNTTLGQRVDLFLEREGEWAIVVEVKVKAPEDGQQIKQYTQWLDEIPERKNYVFHLVKTHDRNFKIKDHGGEATRTWKELYDDLSRAKRDETGTTDASIAEHFCNYLEVEGIVSTWEPTQILAYGKGLVARRALQNLFEQVEARLKDLNLDYQTRIVMPPNEEWPRLEVGRTSWTVLLGNKGYLTNVWACHQAHHLALPAWPWQASEGGEAERFYFQILLWGRGRGGDWEAVHPKIRACLKALREQSFAIWSWLATNKQVGIATDDYNFTESPKHICACSSEEKLALIPKDKIRTMAADDLVDEVYRRTLQHCEIFSRLCSCQ